MKKTKLFLVLGLQAAFLSASFFACSQTNPQETEKLTTALTTCQQEKTTATNKLGQTEKDLAAARATIEQLNKQLMAAAPQAPVAPAVVAPAAATPPAAAKPETKKSAKPAAAASKTPKAAPVDSSAPMGTTANPVKSSTGGL